MRVWRRFSMGGSISLSLTDGDFEGLVPDPNQPEVIIGGAFGGMATTGWSLRSS